MDPEPVSIILTNSSELLLGVFGLVLLLILSAITAGSEVAFFLLSPEKIDLISGKNKRKANLIFKNLKQQNQLQVSLNTATVFFNISFVVLFLMMQDYFFPDIENHTLKNCISIAIITVCLLFFGEVLPRMLARRNNIGFTLTFLYPMLFISTLFNPISYPIRCLSESILKQFGVKPGNISVDELSQALEMSDYKEGTNEEQKILEGIVAFGTTEVTQVMSPRIDIFALEYNETFEAILPKIIENGYSRIPVYSESIDQVEGVLFVKDIVQHLDKDNNFAWQSLLRPPFFVPENKKLDNLLKEFKNLKNHLAIVVDEYGGTSGLITLEDIIEEIVGDISDEFDDKETLCVQLDDRNFLFDGKVGLKDFYKFIPVDEELFEEARGDAETLAGFVLEIASQFPKKKEQISFGDCIFTVENVEKRRLKQIKVTLTNHEETE